MKQNIQDSLVEIILEALKPLGQETAVDINLDLPTDARFGDLSSSIALRLSKRIRKPPLEIAQFIVDSIRKQLEQSPAQKNVREVKVEGGGFIKRHH